MGIDLKGLDPWPNVGGVAGGVLDGASVAAGLATPGVGWVSVGLKLLTSMMSGDTSQQATGSSGQGQLNTSGWVVGEGDATGGRTASSNNPLAAMPWWGWAGLTMGAVILIRKAN